MSLAMEDAMKFGVHILDGMMYPARFATIDDV